MTTTTRPLDVYDDDDHGIRCWKCNEHYDRFGAIEAACGDLGSFIENPEYPPGEVAKVWACSDECAEAVRAMGEAA